MKNKILFTIALLVLVMTIKLFGQNVKVTPQNTGTVKDIDGNIYKTVKIGNQTWMAENLRTTKYNNGVSIPYATKEEDWINFKADAFAWYEYKPTQKTKHNLIR